MKMAIFSEVLWKPLENYVVYEPLEILHVSSFDLKLKLAIANCILKPYFPSKFEGNLKSKCSAFCPFLRQEDTTFLLLPSPVYIYDGLHTEDRIPKFEKSIIKY